MLASISRRLDAILRPDPSKVPFVCFEKDVVTVRIEYRYNNDKQGLYCIYYQCYYICEEMDPMPTAGDIEYITYWNLKQDRIYLSRFTEFRSTDNGMAFRIKTEFARAPANVSSFQMPYPFGRPKKEEFVLTWKECETIKLFPVDSSTKTEKSDVSVVIVALNFDDKKHPCIRLMVGHHEFRLDTENVSGGNDIKSFLWSNGVRLIELTETQNQYSQTQMDMHTVFEDSTHVVRYLIWREYTISDNDD